LRNRVNLDSLRGKIVLIGMMNSASQESFQTPLSLGERPEYAVEIQADLIETLLGNYLLREQDRLTQILVIFLVALLAGATLPHVQFVSAIGLTLLYFVMYLSYAFQKFDEGIVVQPVYPILALLLTAGGTIVFRYFSEERPRAFLGRLFRRYVSPDAVDQVLRNFENGTLPMEGSRRMVSILYVDLRDFGPLTDSLAPSAAIKILNQYMTLIVGTVFRHGGSLSKHTGDTLIAVWNLPLDQVDHARRAVRAAMEIRRDLRAITAAQPKDTAIQVGIAIATGNVIAGHIGASPRAEYTILGEVVGMAERMAMKSDRGVFIDLATREQVGDEYETQEANPVRLRRRTDPVLVWQIVEPLELEEKPDAQKKTEADPN
jgi:adenylate cyclase